MMLGTTDGSPLYQRQIAPRNDELMHKVWDGTPWICDIYTGKAGDDRDYEMRQWCNDEFGPEASPIHRILGCWHRGNATVFGWTWFGFETAEMMQRFLARWSVPNVD